MIRTAIATFLVFAALACPAVCGMPEREADGHCCPHDGPPATPPAENPGHEDPCQVAPCFCGGAAMPARDQSLVLREVVQLTLQAADFDLDSAVPSGTTCMLVQASPPRPPDADCSLPLLI